MYDHTRALGHRYVCDTCGWSYRNIGFSIKSERCRKIGCGGICWRQDEQEDAAAHDTEYTDPTPDRYTEEDAMPTEEISRTQLEMLHRFMKRTIEDETIGFDDLLNRFDTATAELSMILWPEGEEEQTH
jgi:hypothetical protein